MKRNGKEVEVDLTKITPDELRALATGKPVAAKKLSKPSAPKSDEGRKVSSAIAKNKSLSGITVAEGDRQLSFEGVRYDQVPELGRTLSKLSLDE